VVSGEDGELEGSREYEAGEGNWREKPEEWRTQDQLPLFLPYLSFEPYFRLVLASLPLLFPYVRAFVSIKSSRTNIIALKKAGVLLADLFKMYQAGEYSDLVIIAQDADFKVHRCIVCTASPMVKAACDGLFKVGFSPHCFNVTNRTR
jgi:hypothetical protein